MSSFWRVILIASIAANLGAAAFVAFRLATRRPPAENTYPREREELFAKMTTTARIVMLGDSLTDRGEWQELLGATDVVNRGIAGDTIRGATKRLGPVFAAKPQVVAVMLGINDLLAGRPVTECLADYRALLAALKTGAPGAKLLVQSVLPATRTVSAAVKAMNDGLRVECAKGTCTYVDVYPALATADGTLDPQHTYDGVHLRGGGYVRWSEVLAAAIATGS